MKLKKAKLIATRPAQNGTDEIKTSFRYTDLKKRFRSKIWRKKSYLTEEAHILDGEHFRLNHFLGQTFDGQIDSLFV